MEGQMSEPFGRRALLGGVATIGAASLLSPKRAAAAAGFGAIAFDGLALFDPRPVASLAKEHLGERGAPLLDLWRTKQFDYQWLWALGGRHGDFLAATNAALKFAAKSLEI
jgi:2-haloacid dehalogenase